MEQNYLLKPTVQFNKNRFFPFSYVQVVWNITTTRHFRNISSLRAHAYIRKFNLSLNAYADVTIQLLSTTTVPF